MLAAAPRKYPFINLAIYFYFLSCCFIFLSKTNLMNFLKSTCIKVVVQ